MNILFASSEVFPFSKTGGLADVASFLPKALNNKGINVTTVTPYYPTIFKYHSELKLLGEKTIYFGLDNTKVYYYLLEQENNKIIFVQNQHYFEREYFYGYEDDDLRYMVFSYAVLELIDLLDNVPQIIHINDWQTGPIPYLLDEHYRYREKYKYIHTLLTIHNLAYQGNFPLKTATLFNTDFNYTYIHFDRVNYLKSGIERATKINTVSPNYRNEIMTAEFGFSLDGALKSREKDLVGILNGIDEDVFNSKTDKLINPNYDGRNFKKGKNANKMKLLNDFKIEAQADQPLISYIGRLASQKGLEFIEDVIEDVINYSDANFIVLGSGEEKYQNYFNYLKEKYPNRVAYYQGYSENLAHKIYAASDIFLMPSNFEPCGLGQLISMRYGTIPVVREVGGLKDTVKPYNKFEDTGTGFSFYSHEPNVFKDKIFEALNLYKEDKVSWGKLVRRAMKEENSVEKMASNYIKLYKEIIGGK